MRLTTITTAVSLALLTGCGHPQSMFAPGGPAANHLANLGWFVFSLFIIVAVVMWALLGWAVSRRRGSFAEHAPIDVGGGQPWILIGGFAIPFVILAVVFVVGLDAMTEFPLEGPHETRSPRGAGRPRRATGCSAAVSSQERQSVSVPRGLPARPVIPQLVGVCP